MKGFIESFFSSEKAEPVGFKSMEDLPSHEDIIDEPSKVPEKEEYTIDETSVSSEKTLAPLILPEEYSIDDTSVSSEESQIRPPILVPIHQEVKEEVIDSESVPIKQNNRCLSNCNIM